MSFVHLHSHTSYSLLDGAGKIKGMVQRTAELGMKALAITDHGNMFGALEFYNESVNAGIKPIIGMEAYIAPKERTHKKAIEQESHSYHLVLLAKNQVGFKNLIKLSSMAYLEGFYYKPRIDKEILKEYSEGLIATSACMKGEIPYKLRRGMREQAIKSAEYYLELFGDDFYLEIQDHHIPEEALVYPQVYALGKEMGIPVIATNDNHYLHKGDHEAHDILLCLQTGKDRDDPNRMRYGTEELYLKSADEMFQLFKDKPEVLERTLEIEEKIDLKIDFSQRYLPEFPIPAGEGGIDADEYLRRLTFRGAEQKYQTLTIEIKERIDFELGVIKQMGYAGYFLITQDFIQAARDKDIPVGLGRGSAAGSIVSYNLGITDVDPLKYDLLFERFLNPDRISMPDIDIDFCVERRDEVIDYVREKYGKKNVAQIITFGTMASKGVIRDVSRILKIPISRADSIAKLIPAKAGKGMALEKAMQVVPEIKELAETDDRQIQELFKYALTLEGISRHTSIHAAGIIITPEEIDNYVPLYKTGDGEIATQWTMGWSEKIGLLKMDFLGLRNLTVIQKTEKMISERIGEKFDVSKAPIDDEKTFKLFGDGLTVGVFQFESSGMQEYLKKLKPSRIEDLIAMNALYRPGPMSMIDDFIDRKYGRKKIEYLHPDLEPILNETYGIIVYQEQVMRIASDLGGFSLAQADIMRRAMGKKKKEEMDQQKDKFVTGCIQKGINKKIAQDIAELIVKFAQYGFNKSHSAAYAIIAYQTAYLKTHYPAEFMSANLTTEMTNGDRVMVLMDECKKIGLKVKAPDVNYSQGSFMPIEKNVIAFGMEAIKNVGSGAIASIVEARELDGTSPTIFDLLQNVDLRLVNKKVLENLIQAGAMDSLEGSRAQLFASIEKATTFAQNMQGEKNRNKNQRNLFDITQTEDQPDELVSFPELPVIPEWGLTEKLKKEKELLGFYISGHPLERYRNIIHFYSTRIDDYLSKSEDVPNKAAPSSLYVCGQILDFRTILDRKQQKMAFLKIEDFKRNYEVIIFGSVYPLFEPFLKQDNLIMVSGALSNGTNLDDDPVKIIGEQIYPLEQVPQDFTDSILFQLNKEQITEKKLHTLKTTLSSSPGKSRVYMDLQLNGGGTYRLLSGSFKINMTLNTLDELNKIVGTENLQIQKRER